MAKIVEWLPLLVYGCFNITEFYDTTGSGITVSSIILLGAILCYFKDSFKAWITKPSTFKYVCICWFIALIMYILGEKMFVVSTILLCSFVAAFPLEAWAANLKKQDAEKDSWDKLKDLLLEHKNDNSKI